MRREVRIKNDEGGECDIERGDEEKKGNDDDAEKKEEIVEEVNERGRQGQEGKGDENQ